MSKKKSHENNDDVLKGIGIIIPKIPSLIFRSAGAYLRFKSDVKKAGKIFEKELIAQGLDSKTAAGLTNLYLEGSNIFKSIFEKNQ